MAELIERDVFISHEKTDGDVALELAELLRAAGYSTWCYEEDSSAGGSYLVQIDRAIEAARSMVVIVSPHSLRSPHVRNEIVRAYESQKHFIPIRRGMAHEDVLKAQDAQDDERRREWRMAFGAAVSVPWNASDPQSVVNKVAAGLRQVGLTPTSGRAYAPPRQPAEPVQRTPAAKPFDSREAGARFVADLGLPSDMPAFRSALQTPAARVLAAGIVGALGALTNLQALFNTIAPSAGGFVYVIMPLTRAGDLVAAAAGLLLSVRLSRAAWRLFQGDLSAQSEVRKVTTLELALIGVWLSANVFLAFFAIPQGAETMKGPMLSGLIRTALTDGLPVALVRHLFKNSSQIPAAQPV
ncbi:MAG: toll/interleukin-1 receptor domain-containing protein [Gemmatimonadales bacterium]